MKKHFFSIPSFVELTKENGWDNLDEKKTQYFVMRSHFMMKTRPVEDFERYGEILMGLEKPEHVHTERLVSLETEKEYINFEETFKQISIETQEIQEIADELKVEFGLEKVGKINLSNNSKLVEILKHSYTNGLKNCQTIKYNEKRKYELKNIFDKELTEKVYLVKAYQKYAFDIYLTHIDYLFVHYTKSLLGLRKKRKKTPKIDNPKRHSNIIKLNVPISTIHFWRYSPDSNCIIKESVYKNNVPNPDEFIVLTPEDLNKYYAPFPNIPTLYQLSNAAFPFKWVERNCEWSKEELLAIENKDYEEYWAFRNK